MKSASQGIRLNLYLKDDGVVSGLGELGKVAGSPNVLFQLPLRGQANLGEGAVHRIAESFHWVKAGLALELRQFLLDLLLHQFHVFESLIVDAMIKKLVKVKFMLHQESNVARLELHHGVAEDV